LSAKNFKRRSEQEIIQSLQENLAIQVVPYRGESLEPIEEMEIKPNKKTKKRNNINVKMEPNIEKRPKFESKCSKVKFEKEPDIPIIEDTQPIIRKPPKKKYLKLKKLSGLETVKKESELGESSDESDGVCHTWKSDLNITDDEDNSDQNRECHDTISVDIVNTIGTAIKFETSGTTVTIKDTLEKENTLETVDDIVIEKILEKEKEKSLFSVIDPSLLEVENPLKVTEILGQKALKR